jgi:hypothetical protein
MLKKSAGTKKVEARAKVELRALPPKPFTFNDSHLTDRW